MKSLKAIIALAAASALSASAATTEYTPVVENLEMTRSETGAQLLNVAYSVDRSAWKVPSNTEVILTPVVVFEADSVRLEPLILAGRNAYLAHKRNDDLPASADLVRAKGEPLSRSLSIPWQKGMMRSRLIFLTETRGCRCRDEGMRTLPETLAMDFTPKPTEHTLPPAPVAYQPRLVTKSAFVNYRLGSDMLLQDYDNNAPELAEITATIDSIRSGKDIAVERVTIHGYASPEGPYDLNTRLAGGRAEALRAFVDEKYGFGDRIETLSTPEDWRGLRRWLEKSDIPDRTAIIGIIDSANEDDAKEKSIRTRFPEAWERMLKEAFPALRRADYTIMYQLTETGE